MVSKSCDNIGVPYTLIGPVKVDLVHQIIQTFLMIHLMILT